MTRKLTEWVQPFRPAGAVGGLALALALLGCQGSEAPATSSTATAQTKPGATSQADTAGSTAQGGEEVLHPVTLDVDHCKTMYTACPKGAKTGTDELCTSAPFTLDCGKSGKHPTSGKMMRCECSKKEAK